MERDLRDGLLWRLPPYDSPPAIDIFLVTNPRAKLNRAERLSSMRWSPARASSTSTRWRSRGIKDWRRDRARNHRAGVRVEDVGSGKEAKSESWVS